MDHVPSILVLEDEPLIRRVVVEALEEGGYSVAVAEGDLALAQIDAAEQLRGLVTDIRLGRALMVGR